MFDFLRNFTKSAEEKRQERLNAYLDNALSARERRRFEQELEQDAGLRAELEALRWVKLSVQQVPRVRAPRNFVLDPAVYGQKDLRGQGVLSGFYPNLRVATALTAFFFMLALALDLATPYGALNRPLLGTGASQVAMQESSREGNDAAMVGAEELESAPAAADEAPAEAEEPAEAPEPEISAFAITEEPAVGEVAEEAAEDGVQEEAITAAQPQAEEEAAQEEEVQEQPEAQTPVEPGVGGATTGDARTAESTEAAEGEALLPQGTPAPPSPELTVTDAHTPTVVTPTASVDDTADLESQIATRTATQFPYLLVIEIVLGAALAGLVVVMLILRRGG